MTKDDLGDRMKALEGQETSRKAPSDLPIYVRIDGRGFSKFTRGMTRPYDCNMSMCMINTTKILVDKTHATIGYVQSDEISLVFLPSEVGHNWFDGKIMKMTSVLAGLATAAFTKSLHEYFPVDVADKLSQQMPHFDARVVPMPSMSETTNMLLWRNLDAIKNAISMAANHYFSHKILQGKSSADKLVMLKERGVDFDAYPSFFKRGTWIRRETVERVLSKEELTSIPEKHRPLGNQLITRTAVQDFDLPPLNTVANRTEVLFHGSAPVML